MNEQHALLILTFLSITFLCGFWFLPNGVLFLRKLAGGEIQVDLRPMYSPKTLYRLLDKYGTAGRRSFQTMLYADMIFPAVYGATIYILGSMLSANHPSTALPFTFVQYAGIAASTCDYGENVFLLCVLNRLPKQSDILARCAGIFTSLKILSFIIAVVSILLGFYLG